MAIMSDDKEPASTSTPLPKYSRYRRQTIKPEPEPQPVPVQKPDNDFSRSKSMSRYRRSVVPAKAAQIADSSNPPVPTLPRAQNTIGAEGRNVIRRVTEPVNNVQAEERNGENSGRSQGRYRETEEERMRRKVKEFQEREEQQRRVQQAKAEQERLRQQRREEEELQRMAEEEPERLLAEQKRKDLERLQAELDAAPPPLMPVVSPKKEKFGFFSRKRAATKTTPPTTSGSGSGTNSMSKSRSNEPPRSTEVPRSTDIPRGIEQGGGGIVPQTDAPISASNAGERVSVIDCVHIRRVLTFSREFLFGANNPPSIFQLPPKLHLSISYILLRTSCPKTSFHLQPFYSNLIHSWVLNDEYDGTNISEIS